MRNGDQIGTHTIAIETSGAQTTVTAVTHIEVSAAFLTLYRFDQTETERWSNRQLLSLTVKTDDNGTVHTTNAGQVDNALAVKCDDHDARISAKMMPLDLWNPALLSQNAVLDLQSGAVVPLKVVDRGEDDFVSNGRTTRAHHYVITTSFAQDVWYGGNGELMGVQITGRDGSIIRYQPA